MYSSQHPRSAKEELQVGVGVQPYGLKYVGDSIAVLQQLALAAELQVLAVFFTEVVLLDDVLLKMQNRDLRRGPEVGLSESVKLGLRNVILLVPP